MLFAISSHEVFVKGSAEVKLAVATLDMTDTIGKNGAWDYTSEVRWWIDVQVI